MATFGNGYGSECHLLRYLGRHRECLNRSVCEVVSATDVRWLDFRFATSWPGEKPESLWPDEEWKSLDFLEEQNPDVVVAWKKSWPHGRGVMNWDAVGKIEVDGTWEWMLVEAKSHTGELHSQCGAKSKKSIGMIKNTFEKVKSTLGAKKEDDWIKGYYQYANRLAILHHLTKHNVKARLLFVYFCGDKWPKNNKNCPKNEAGWGEALEEQAKHLGLDENHQLVQRIHKLFLPVWVDPEKLHIINRRS